MLGLGFLTYIKIGIVAALVIVSGYLVYNYKHMQTTITTLKAENASFKSQLKVVADKQKNFDSYIKGGQVIKRKVASDVETNKEVVQSSVKSGDPAPVLDRLHSYQLRAKGDIGNPKNGGASRPRSARP